MPAHVLSDDTQAVLLLCGSLGTRRGGKASPLSTLEYSRLAQWLHQRGMRPGDLLSGFPPDDGSIPIPRDRVAALLERSAALALNVERWANRGLWVISRGDHTYPRRLKNKLGKHAPPILYGAGDVSLMDVDGLAIVGSRDADADAERFATLAAERCAERSVAVISGGARGVDSIAMGAALDAGGTVVGILTESLERAATSGRYRGALRDGRLVLASPYDPGARFSVGAAMGRNKVVYALSRWALVVSSSEARGGTWTGATENLGARWVPLFVRDAENAPAGNVALVTAGGVGLSLRALESASDLPELLDGLASQRDARVSVAAPPTLFDAPAPTAPLPAPVESADRPDIYNLVWPRIAELLVEGRTEKEVAAALGLEVVQARTWLKRSVELGRASRPTRSPRYQLVQNAGGQLQLLDSPAELPRRKAKPGSRATKPKRSAGPQPHEEDRQSSAA
jgi:predicted Rossmann fold nucleotide-binding protein DprA/Smf involved in DNA uptake